MPPFSIGKESINIIGLVPGFVINIIIFLSGKEFYWRSAFREGSINFENSFDHLLIIFCSELIIDQEDYFHVLVFLPYGVFQGGFYDRFWLADHGNEERYPRAIFIRREAGPLCSFRNR